MIELVTNPKPPQEKAPPESVVVHTGRKGKLFLNLVDKDFPSTNNRFSKIFNRHPLKTSFSYTLDVKEVLVCRSTPEAETLGIYLNNRNEIFNP